MMLILITLICYLTITCTVVTEVLSSGRTGPVAGACEVFLDVDASHEAGLFSPDGEISEYSLNNAQILPSSSEVLEC